MKESSSAIIMRPSDSRVFIAKRSKNKEFSPSKWETVGGRVEEGETIEGALIREVKEELDTEIKSFKFFRNYYYDGRNFKTFIVELDSKPIPNKNDFDDWGWFSKKEIEKIDFAVNCKERIIDYYNNLK
jgi:8-oxo-dGTP diphosphatase